MFIWDFSIDTGLVIFFLGIIVVSLRNLKKEVCNLKKIAWQNHPEDMKKV